MLRRLLLPIGLTSLGLGLLAARELWSPWLAGSLERWLPFIAIGLRSLVWLSITWIVIRVIDGITRARIRRQSGRPAPRLLRELIAAGVLLASASGLAIFIFGAPPAAAITTSGVLVAVVGFAVRSMIADLFYGVTLALERPFDIGDWVGIADGAAEQKVGRVEEFTWRSVKLITRENVRVIVPNSLLATNHVVNFDQPEPVWRSSLEITLGYEVRPEQAKRLLLAAVQQVSEMRAIPREPEALAIRYEPEGVVWELRFWVPNYVESTRVAQLLHEALLQSLRFAGVSVPRSREEVYLQPLAEERAHERDVARRWIDQVAIFAPLPDLEREELQRRSRRVELPAGAEVVRKGELGASLFVVRQGALDVRLEPDGSPAIGVMGPGDVFGEMSLLTGEERTATVTTSSSAVINEITKADVEPLLQRHSDLVRELAAVMEERTRADVERATALDEAETTVEGRRQQLAERVRAWFKLPSARLARTEAVQAD